MDGEERVEFRVESGGDIMDINVGCLVTIDY